MIPPERDECQLRAELYGCLALTLVDADSEPGEESFIAQCSPLKPDRRDITKYERRMAYFSQLLVQLRIEQCQILI